MSLLLHRADYFWADLTRQVDWYRDEANPKVAERFVDAVETIFNTLLKQPEIGRARFWNWPELEGIRSIRVTEPFHRFLIFYRFDDSTLYAERLIHGGRDLPRRLLESPYGERP